MWFTCHQKELSSFSPSKYLRQVESSRVKLSQVPKLDIKPNQLSWPMHIDVSSLDVLDEIIVQLY